MDDFYEWDDEEEDDDPLEAEEFRLEDMCVEPGCTLDGSFGSCGCCGGPLCFMHEEILAGFCTTCSTDPNFAQRMRKIYGEMDEGEQTRHDTSKTSAAYVEDEIPF